MKVLVTLLVLALFPVASIAEDLSFSEAKARSDRIEAELSSGEMSQLLEAQGRLAGSAFPHCISSTGSLPTDFTVVVRIDGDGRISDSWLDKDSVFGSCFRAQMAQDFQFVPSETPFFTSFEYKNAP